MRKESIRNAVQMGLKCFAPDGLFRCVVSPVMSGRGTTGCRIRKKRKASKGVATMHADEKDVRTRLFVFWTISQQ